MKVVEGKFVVAPFKPRRSTQDRMTRDKLIAVRKHREFLEKADDLVAAVFGGFPRQLTHQA